MTDPSKQFRAQLQAIAGGAAAEQPLGSLDPTFVAQHQPDFLPWLKFCVTGGEPLVAPAVLLPPLP